MMTGYPPLPAGLKKRALAGAITRYRPINASTLHALPKPHFHPYSQAQPVFKPCGKTVSAPPESGERLLS